MRFGHFPLTWTDLTLCDTYLMHYPPQLRSCGQKRQHDISYMEAIWIFQKQQNTVGLQNMLLVATNKDGKDSKSFPSPENVPSQ